jgi:hypothetical protein
MRAVLASVLDVDMASSAERPESGKMELQDSGFRIQDSE